MLDVWQEERDPADLSHKVELLKSIRSAIGNDRLIMVNANASKLVRSAPYINGLFMEAQAEKKPYDKKQWENIIGVLTWAESNLREPRVNALELTWNEGGSRNDLHTLRAATAMSMIYSNGYALFADPNVVNPNTDHGHTWNALWDCDMGQPIGTRQVVPNGSYAGLALRWFERGVVVLNPRVGESYSMQQTFSKRFVNILTGEVGQSFWINGGDALFLREELAPKGPGCMH